jgi:hypothetical protein
VTRYLLLSFSLAVILSSCAVNPGPTKPIERPDPSNIGTLSNVETLLELASTAYTNNRLTTPSDDNALRWFQAVLVLERDNALAKAGINAIVEKYLSWALGNVDKKRLTRARQYVAKAEQIDASHPNLQAVVNRINDREEIKASVFTLDSSAVKRRAVSAEHFRRIAVAVESKQAFVVIRAPDDPSGRWIYQELNKRVNYRIEARFEIDRQASVSLMY